MENSVVEKDIIHSCGHTERHHLIENDADRQVKILAEEPCTDCYMAKITGY